MRDVEILGDVTRHPFRNSQLSPFFVCPIDRCQIIVELEPSGLMLGLVQRLKDWFDVSPGLGIETDWARKSE
jgi:hypothetical protein